MAGEDTLANVIAKDYCIISTLGSEDGLEVLFGNNGDEENQGRRN
jgi:hypothetical protein